MKKLLVIIVQLLFVMNLFAEEIVSDKDGRRILLNDDFTWEYLDDDSGEMEIGETIILKRKRSFDTPVSPDKDREYTIFIDPDLWEEAANINEQAEIQLQLESAEGYGLLLYDGLYIPLEKLKKILIINAHNIDPNAKILSVNRCVVNGIEGELVKYEASTQGLTFIFLTFITSNDDFTIQFSFFTLDNSFERLESKFLDAIAGFEIPLKKD